MRLTPFCILWFTWIDAAWQRLCCFHLSSRLRSLSFSMPSRRAIRKPCLALLRAGADVNAARDDGSTALLWAASRDDAEIVAALLKAGANPNKADENGETALLLAAGNGNTAIARMLLDAKADVNAARWNGDTPLLAAVNAGNPELVRLMVDRGRRSMWRKTAWDKHR